MGTIKKKAMKNRLAHIRHSNHLEQKQVATLLGHKTTETISRYERGLKVPNLKTALKLARIYGIPIRVMLDEYYEACLQEMRRQEERLLGVNKIARRSDEGMAITDFCTYEHELSSESPSEAAIIKVRRHSSALIRKTADKLGHF
jgi:transcriptional regulator with XRE-family HTH domain